MATKLLYILNKAKKIVIIPIVLKKIPVLLGLMVNELKLIKPSTGRVPSAKANIVNAPVQKLCVESV